MVWGEDGDVSVHTESEFREHPPEEKREVGGICSVKFTGVWYTGKIASMGKSILHGKGNSISKHLVKTHMELYEKANV